MKIFTESIRVRITKKQREEIERKCNHLGMKESDYIRMKLFQPDNIEWKETKLKLRKLFLEEDGK